MRVEAQPAQGWGGGVGCHRWRIRPGWGETNSSARSRLRACRALSTGARRPGPVKRGSIGCLRPHELAQEACQMARFHLAQMCAEMRCIGPGIERPHGAAQCAPPGSDEENVVAGVELTLVAFDEPLARQAVH